MSFHRESIWTIRCLKNTYEIQKHSTETQPLLWRRVTLVQCQIFLLGISLNKFKYTSFIFTRTYIPRERDNKTIFKTKNNREILLDSYIYKEMKCQWNYVIAPNSVTWLYIYMREINIYIIVDKTTYKNQHMIILQFQRLFSSPNSYILLLLKFMLLKL